MRIDCWVLVTTAVMWCGLASAGAPTVERFTPAGGQRGTEFMLSFVGAGFSHAAEVLFYGPGLDCRELKAASDNELQIRIFAAPEAPVGAHPFRIRNPQGLSELHTLFVTNLPVVAESEPNNSFDAPNIGNRNVAWAGVLEAGDVDSFSIALRKGERLSAEVCAVRTGGVLLDTSIRVYGPDGSQIGNVDDTALFRQDPFLTLVAPREGRYVVQVEGTNLDGNDDSRYLLFLGDFPRPAAVYPAGGRAGTKLTVQCRGDALGTFEQTIDVPDFTTAEFGVMARSAGREAPTAMPFRVSPFPNVLEESGNPSPASLPVAFNGFLAKAGEQDEFRFAVADLRPVQFESFAYRIGSPADTVIAIIDRDGQTLVSNDDDGSHDSRLVFFPPSTGEYLLRVADKRKAGRPDFLYRIEATPVEPQLTAFLSRPERLSQDRQTVCVPRGNRVMTPLAVQRRNFKGEVQLSLSGGPAGLLFSEARIDADRFWTPTIVEASKDAPLAAGLAELVASGTLGGKAVRGGFQQVVDLINGPADALFQAAVVDRLAVAVIEPVPFRIHLAQPATALPQDGTMDLALSLERDPGFTRPVEVVLPFLPPWVDGPAAIVIPPGETRAVYRLRADAKSRVRDWQLCAEATAGGTSGRRAEVEVTPGASDPLPTAPPPAIAVASELIRLSVQASPVRGELQSGVTEQGVPTTLKLTLDFDGEVPDSMIAELEGLPNRVTSSPVTIRRGDQQASFDVLLAPDSPIGVFQDLVCRLSGSLRGQPVSYCVGRGGTLRIEARGSLVKDRTGRPLSRLEVLQRQQSAPQSPSSK